MIDSAGVQLRAILQLSINAGCGNAGGSAPLIDALDLDSERVTRPRPKTEVMQRVKR